MISNRLKKIASLVSTSTVIDVGCDHALLDIYLTKEGKTCRGIDISKNCIERAYENVKKSGLENKIELIVNNGLDNINILKTDTIVIAGMGTSTILKILKDINENDLILVSNNDIYTLRKEIIKKGYIIEDEIAIKENNYYYVIIKFTKGNKKYNYKDYILGPILKEKDYYLHLYNKEYKNYKKIPKRLLLIRLKEYKKVKMIKNKLKAFD